jgi:hypothetical protein
MNFNNLCKIWRARPQAGTRFRFGTTRVVK